MNEHSTQGMFVGVSIALVVSLNHDYTIGQPKFSQEPSVTTLNKQTLTDSSHYNYGILDWLLATVHNVYPTVVKEHPSCERAIPLPLHPPPFSQSHTHTYGSGGQSLLNGAHTECSMDYLPPRKTWPNAATVHTPQASFKLFNSKPQPFVKSYKC